MTTRKIKPGECVYSIAAEVKLPWETIWNHANNRELKTKRRLPNVLAPGDRLFVPEVGRRNEDAGTAQSSTFSVTTPRTCLRLRLLDDGKPIANTRYRIKAGDKMINGSTNGKGELQELIEPGLTEATLKVFGRADTFKLLIGYLDPVKTTAGLQARLENLGFPTGGVDGDWGRASREGMQEFQSKHALETTERPDEATESRLEKEFGS